MADVGGMTLDELFGTVEQEWQDQALCAQTDPEAFFPEKGGSTREAKRVRPVQCVMSAWSTHSSMMSALVFGAACPTVSAAA